MPIGYAFNYPAVLASTNWANKQVTKRTGDLEMDYGRASGDKVFGYAHASGASVRSEKVINWYDFARRILNFTVRHAMDEAGKYGVKTGEKSKQEKLPLDEGSMDTVKWATSEEEHFAIANIDKEYNSFLENFIVQILVPHKEVTGASVDVAGREPKMFKGWEEYGQRQSVSGKELQGGKLVRGPKAIVPLDMNIIFTLDEEAMREHMDVAADMVEWMDNNLDKIQQHAEALLQEYNKIYLDDIKRRVDMQSHEEGAAENAAVKLGEARDELQKELGPLRDDKIGPTRIRFNAMYDGLTRNKELLVHFLMDWKEGEPMPDGLKTHWNDALQTLQNFRTSKPMRELYVTYIKKLESMPSDEDENVHSRFFLWAAGWEPGAPGSPHESVQEARSDLLGDLFQGYENVFRSGESSISEMEARAPRDFRPVRFLKALEDFNFEAEEAYWRAKASRTKRKAEREKQKSLDFPSQEPEDQVDEGCGPAAKPRKLKIRIGKRT